MPQQIELTVPARIHLGLIGMGCEGPRINGGIGFAIKDPCLSIRVSEGATTQVDDRRLHPLEAHEIDRLVTLISKVCKECGLARSPSLMISGDTQSHKGLGAGTAIRLAAIEGTFLLNDRQISPSELIRRSQRGGTSGVGVRTYFEGGLTIDLGHKATGGQRPSYAWQEPAPPLQLARIDMPNWKIGICIPSNIRSLSHEAERQVFESTVPIHEGDVHRTLFLALFGVFAAAKESDLSTFFSSIEQLQRCAWKSAEWRAHGRYLVEVADVLSAAGARGFGLSSMGPTFIFSASDLFQNRLPDEVRRSVRIVEPQNIGRRITSDGVAMA